MRARVDPMGDGIYRVAVTVPGSPITYNQFVIDDERPALVHTGTHQMYDEVRKAVALVLDPARLAYLVIPHFEADECGGMGRFAAAAHDAALVCSDAGAVLNLRGWDYAGEVLGVRDGDRIELGTHTLRFLETPHVHHWDSMMAIEESTGGLFTSDLFIQPDDQPPIVHEDLSEAMCRLYRESGIFAAAEPVLRVVDRIEGMAPRWVHPMHGGSLSAAMVPAFTRALRERSFAFEGRLFGREIPGLAG